MKAIWGGQVIAESDDTVVVEGNHYFPESAVKVGVLTPTDHHTVCPWKGTASYYSVQADGQTNVNAAWTYPAPKEAAKRIMGRVAFWKGIQVRP